MKLPVIVLKSIFHEQKKVKSFLTRGDARVTELLQGLGYAN